MLNPQRWGAATGTTGGHGAFPFARMSSWNANGREGYVRDFEKGGDGTLFDVGVDDDDDADAVNEKATSEKSRCKFTWPVP